MSLFKRNQDTTDTTITSSTGTPTDTTPISLPESPEVTPDYYQTPPEPSAARRPLLIVAGALSALLVVFGLVMGGRWLYHTLQHTGVKTATTTSPTAPKSSSPTPAPSTTKPNATTPSQNTSPTPTPSTTKPNTTTTPTPTQTPTQNSQTTTPTTPSTTPTTPSRSPLTNTGPGETLAIFVVVSILGMSAYQLRLRQRNRV